MHSIVVYARNSVAVHCSFATKESKEFSLVFQGHFLVDIGTNGAFKRLGRNFFCIPLKEQFTEYLPLPLSRTQFSVFLRPTRLIHLQMTKSFVH